MKSKIQHLIISFILFIFAAYSFGKTSSSAPTRQRNTELTAPLELTVAAIEKRLALVAAATDLDPVIRDWTSSTLSAARESLIKTSSLETKLAEYRSQARAATSQTLQLRERLQNLAASPREEIPSTASTSLLSQLIAQTEAEIAQRQQRLDELQKESQERVRRKSELPQEIASARQELEKIQMDDALPPPPLLNVGLEGLRATALQAMRTAAAKRVELLEAEREFLEATNDLFQLRQDELQIQLENAKKRLSALQSALSTQRQAEAEEAMRQAQEANWRAANAHPEIRRLAEENELLAKRRAEANSPSAKLVAVTTELETVRQQREQIKSQFDSIRKRLEILGSSEVVGQLMRKQRNELPSLSQINLAIKRYINEIAQIQAELIELRDKRAEMPAIELRLRRLLAQQLRFSNEETSQIVNAIVSQRRFLLDSLISELDQLFFKLTELETAYTLLRDETRSFRDFLDEHILWVPSAKPYVIQDAQRAWEGLRDVCSFEHLKSLAYNLYRSVRESPLVVTAAFLVISFLISVRARWRKSYGALLATGSGSSIGRMSAVRLVLLVILDAAIPVPVILGLMGGILTIGTTDSVIAAYALGLLQAAVVLFCTLLFRDLLTFVPTTVASTANWYKLPRVLLWLGIVVSFSAFVLSASRENVPFAKAEALERTVFLLLMVALDVALLQLCLPLHDNVCHAVFSRWSGHSKIISLGVLAAVILPIILGMLSLVGYHYSAVQLLKRLVETVLVGIAWWLCLELIHRWLARLVATHSRSNSEDMPSTAGAKNGNAAEALGVSVDHLLSLTRSQQFVNVLLAVGACFFLWAIWRDMLPAISFITRIQLWQSSITEAAAGASTVYVTVGDVLIALILGVLTIVSVRNLPALVELGFLRRTHLEPGTRYAISALLRYALFLIGLIWISRLLGLSWKSVQWLAAAMTVGLGFGLQEIFANFVSGLILLFERPVRVGDWVTVSGTTGVVTHIRTRATTVRDLDGKEMLIPNKLLITGPVLNWTLSDTGTRLTFEIKTDLAIPREEVVELLRSLSRAHHLVAQNPEPLVLFEGISGNEQKFRLFLHTRRVEDRVTVKDQLCSAIQDEMKRRGFPLLLLDCPL